MNFLRMITLEYNTFWHKYILLPVLWIPHIENQHVFAWDFHD